MNKLLLLIFLVTVIPTIVLYFEHAMKESESFDKARAEGKSYQATKTLAEAIFFTSVGFGYLIMTCWLLMSPKNMIPYFVILTGTVALTILYYCRIFGIPVPFTDIIIVDSTTDWRDIITKNCQQILVIPIAMLLRDIHIERKQKKSNNYVK